MAGVCRFERRQPVGALLAWLEAILTCLMGLASPSAWFLFSIILAGLRLVSMQMCMTWAVVLLTSLARVSCSTSANVNQWLAWLMTWCLFYWLMHGAWGGQMRSCCWLLRLAVERHISKAFVKHGLNPNILLLLLYWMAIIRIELGGVMVVFACILKKSFHASLPAPKFNSLLFEFIWLGA